MSKIYLLQSFPNERDALARYFSDVCEVPYDVASYATDPEGFEQFKRAIRNQTEPVAIVTSQSTRGNVVNFGNRVHAVVHSLEMPTLMIVFSRAVDNSSYADVLGRIVPSSNHQVLMARKSSIDFDLRNSTTLNEVMAVKVAINRFFASQELKKV